MRRGGHVRVNGIRLHYIEHPGPGPELLLIPGITSPAITWGFVAERLAATNRVIVLDNRGRGLSEGGPGIGYATGDCARDGLAVIDALGLDRPVVLGHSMGARIAARMAAITPGAMAKLVLAEPPVSGPGRRPYPTPIEPYLQAIEAASAGVPLAEFRKFSPTWTDEQLALRMEWLPTCGIDAVTESHRAFHTEDLFADLPKIACPTLFLIGTRAAVITDRDADEITSLIRDVRVVRLDTGHMLPWDDLDAFIAAVAPFVASR